MKIVEDEANKIFTAQFQIKNENVDVKYVLCDPVNFFFFIKLRSSII